MKLGVFGLGYVGSVTSLCLASLGHEVMGIEVVGAKVDAFNLGKLSILEPGLQDLCQTVISGKSTGSFTAKTSFSAQDFDVSVVCVGTPSLNTGAVDLNQLTETAEVLAASIKSKTSPQTIIIRSTIPPGTTAKVLIPLLEGQSGKKSGQDFFVCFYPEFLREGLAIGDFFNPSLNVIGCTDDTKDYFQSIIQEIFKVDRKPVTAAISTAEMIKYANNSFHAIKVAFANEIGALAKAYDADGSEVMKLFVTDQTLNLSPYYLRPGFAFGGACLPKELKAIGSLARKKDVKVPLLDSVMGSNDEHINRFISLIGEWGHDKIGFSGITFKPNTDDVRGSPLVTAIELLGEVPTYKNRPRIWVYDDKAVLVKVKDFFEENVVALENAEQLFLVSEVVVLGPHKLDDKAMTALENFDGKIVDLKWHPVPASVSRKRGYYTIC